MQIDVICGCQFGSEAKGLVASKIAQMYSYDMLISTNSSQAGHTAPFFKDGKYIQDVVTRQLPASCINNHEARIYIAPGAIINPSVLDEEVERIENLGVPVRKRLFIHPYATIISQSDIEFERHACLDDKIGSTCEGVGSALSRRILRAAGIVKDYPSMLKYNILEPKISPESMVLLEGSQGFGLSNYSSFYPFCTSRDTTVAGILSQAQLPFRAVRHVYGVFRTYPIRVGGKSGPMFEEIDWDILSKRIGVDILEKTTVTKRVRRVGEWDSNLAHRALNINGVDRPILTFLNYINWADMGVCFFKEISDRSSNWILRSEIPWYGISTDNKDGWIFDYIKQ